MQTISIGKLRQNPTEMLRSVREGERYTVTDRGVPVAEIGPVRRYRWVPASKFGDLIRTLGADREWADEIRDDLQAEVLRSPWEQDA